MGLRVSTDTACKQQSVQSAVQYPPTTQSWEHVVSCRLSPSSASTPQSCQRQQQHQTQPKGVLVCNTHEGCRVSHFDSVHINHNAVKCTDLFRYVLRPKAWVPGWLHDIITVLERTIHGRRPRHPIPSRTSRSGQGILGKKDAHKSKHNTCTEDHESTRRKKKISHASITQTTIQCISSRENGNCTRS